MLLKNKTTQKFISSVIIFTMLIPALVIFSKPKEAEAQWIVNDPIHTVVTVKIVIMEILKQMLMTVARKIINQITQSTINWVNEGSWGSPLFLENPDSFFKDIAKYEVKTMVDLFGYDSRRFPFGKDFALNVINSYKSKLESNAEYTLNEVITDPVLLKGYQTDFNVGGWSGFLTNTQYPQNNYLGFQMLATEELARRVSGTAENNVEKVKTTLDQGMGFLSPQMCADNGGNNKYNDSVGNQFKKPTFNEAEYRKTQPYENPYDPMTDGTRWKEYDDEWTSFLAAAKKSWAEDNTCKNLVDTTPGSVVANQIMGSMSSKIRQSELGAALGNSFAAVFDALLNKFMEKGLRALTNKSPAPEEDVLNANDFLTDNVGGINANYFVENTNKLTEKYIDTLIPGGSGGSGGGSKCSDSGNSYGGDLEEAENAVLAENPEVGSLPNIESGGRQNARRFLNLVEEKLKSMGLRATVEVLNGHNNPSTGDIIAVWKNGDEVMERYDAIIGAAKTIAEAATAQFDTFIPLNCYNGGEGQKDCGCKTTGEETPGEPEPTINPNPESGDAYISLVTPVTAKPGTTTITITGDNLTNQVSFFDDNETRNTVVGTLNSTKTQVTVIVPSDQPIGNATVKIYQGKDASNQMIFSNGKLIKISNTENGGSTAIATSTDATGGWGGSLAYNPTNNNWLVVSGGANARIMGNNGTPVTAEFKVTNNTEQTMSPKVAFSPSLNKYLVVWITFDPATIYGRFVNADGTLSGEQFTIFRDSDGSSFLYPNSILQYDSKNKKFVFVWEYRNPKIGINLITISDSGIPGSVVDVAHETTGQNYPSLAINENGNEYCVAYDERSETPAKVAMKKINASTLAVSAKTSLTATARNTSIAYNSTNNQYLVAWGDYAGQTKARILNSCNMTNVRGNTFTINSKGETPSVAYNKKSNNYALIGQNQADSSNTYIITSSTGSMLKTGTAFAGGYGNFVPIISANTTDGSFAATSSIEYRTTRFAPNLGMTTITGGGTTTTLTSQMLKEATDWVGSFETAFDSTNNLYLIAYSTYKNEVKGQWVNASGTAVGTNFKIASGVRPRVIYTEENNTFLISWLDGKIIKGQKISYKSGSFNAESNPITLFDLRWDASSASITYIPSARSYLITWWDANGNQGQTFSRTLSSDNILSGINTLSASGQDVYDSPEIACNTTKCLLVGKYYNDTSTQYGTWGRWLDFEGKPTSEIFFVNRVGIQTGAKVSYNSANNFFLVTWIRDGGWPEASKITTDSTTPGAKFTTFSIRGGKGSQIPIYNKGSSKFNIAVIGWNKDVFVVRLNASGNPISGSTVVNDTEEAILNSIASIATDSVSKKSLVVYKYGNDTIKWKAVSAS